MLEKTYSIFIVEDNDWFQRLLIHTIQLDPEISVEAYTTGKELIKNLNKAPKIITLDYRLPDTNGEKLLKEIKEFDPNIEVIIISEQSDIDTAVQLVHAGAYDYIPKSDNIKERLLNTIHKIRKEQGLKKQINTLSDELGRKFEVSKSVIGNSPAMEVVFKLMEKAIKTKITVSITGETGTGKEMVAKAIHFNSDKKNKPFVAVNVGAIPKDLIESELFGHEKGSFTGAISRKIGKFEEASDGTLFLDEIGEMDLNMQVKLLRALQEREIQRVGGNETVKISARIIVATHKNIKLETEEGRFREDLYYRLLGLPIELPPLRDRENDVIILAKHFLKSFCKENEMDKLGFTSEALNGLKNYTYPGNVRELKSIVELAAVLSDDDKVDLKNLNLSPPIKSKFVGNENLTLRDYNLQIVKAMLDKYSGNTKLVSEKLDIGQSTIYRMIKEIEDAVTE